jgi:hypothetical protein
MLVHSLYCQCPESDLFSHDLVKPSTPSLGGKELEGGRGKGDNRASGSVILPALLFAFVFSSRLVPR